MKGADADMMETENSNDAAADAARNLLAEARRLIQQGKPSEALQAVVMAMKIHGGEQAVSQTLNRAREMYVNKIQATSAADQLAALLAECAIIEGIPSKPRESQEPDNMDTNSAIDTEVQGTPILAETGRRDVMIDAVSDGSSFRCVKCGGVVSIQRRDEHLAFWCSNA